MVFLFSDFNGADAYYQGPGSEEWVQLEAIIAAMPIFLQASDQSGKKGSPIFDPKATNEHLTSEAARLGWNLIPVPAELTQFGNNWDAGRGGTLAEWQFSNYPFLWNNIIRSESVYKGELELPGLTRLRALTIVTKCGLFPASNSTLHYEQARSQVGAATKHGTFSIPIRLVGLALPSGVQQVTVVWSTYPGRYSRKATSEPRVAEVTWKTRKSKYDESGVRFKIVSSERPTRSET